MITPNSSTYVDNNRLHYIKLALILEMLKKKDFRQFGFGEIELYDYLENNLNYYILKEVGDLKRRSFRKEWEKMKKTLIK